MVRIIKDFISRLRADALTNQGVGHGAQGRASYEKSCYEKALAIFPSHCAAHYNLARFYYHRKDYLKAIQHFTEAIQTVQRIGTGKLIKSCYYMRGLCLYHNEEYTKAESDLRKALELDPKGADCHRLLGDILVKIGKLDQALTFYHESLTLNPSEPTTHYNLGLLHEKLGKHEAAVRLYEHALSIKPDHAPAHLGLALIAIKAKDYDKAINHCEYAISFGDKDHEAKLALANIYTEMGSYEEVIVVLDKILTKDHEHPHALLNKGVALSRLGRTKEAIDVTEKLAAIEPKNGKPYYNLAFFYLKENNQTLAARNLKKAAKLSEEARKQAIEDADFERLRERTDVRKALQI